MITSSRGSYWDGESIENQKKADAAAKRRARQENKLFDETADWSLDKLRTVGERDSLVKEADHAIEDNVAKLARIIGTTPELIKESEWNGKQFEEALQTYVEGTGRQWFNPRFLPVGKAVPTWTEDDALRVLDKLAEEGRLELRGHWIRKTPTIKELYDMPREGEGSLRELADASVPPPRHPREENPGRPRTVYTGIPNTF